MSCIQSGWCAPLIIVGMLQTQSSHSRITPLTFQLGGGRADRYAKFIEEVKPSSIANTARSPLATTGIWWFLAGRPCFSVPRPQAFAHFREDCGALPSVWWNSK